MKRRMNRALVKEVLSVSTGLLLDIDIDNFEQVNQQYSRSAGDAILVEVPNRINTLLNEYGISQPAIRIHNDEFIALIPDSVSHAETIVERIMDALKAPYCFHEETIQITVSIGITPYKKHQEWSDGVNRAESAMKEAKKQGKNKAYQA